PTARQGVYSRPVVPKWAGAMTRRNILFYLVTRRIGGGTQQRGEARRASAGLRPPFSFVEPAARRFDEGQGREEGLSRHPAHLRRQPEAELRQQLCRPLEVVEVYDLDGAVHVPIGDADQP